MKKTVCAMFAGLMLLGLLSMSGCANTLEGLGKDIEKIGKDIQD